MANRPRKAPTKDDLKSKTTWKQLDTDYVYPAELLKAAHYDTDKSSYEDRPNLKLAEIVGRAISVETDEREAADAALLTGLGREEADRKAADAALQEQIDTNKANIETNRQNIAKNAEDIAKNAEDIAQNAADIETNRQAISQETQDRKDADDALKASIDANAEGIAKNTEDIAQNKADIKEANERIDANADAIAEANGIIQQNTDAIKVVNKGVEKNASDLATANDAIAANAGSVAAALNKFAKDYFVRGTADDLAGTAGDDVLLPLARVQELPTRTSSLPWPATESPYVVWLTSDVALVVDKIEIAAGETFTNGAYASGGSQSLLVLSSAPQSLVPVISFAGVNAAAVAYRQNDQTIGWVEAGFARMGASTADLVKAPTGAVQVPRTYTSNSSWAVASTLEFSLTPTDGNGNLQPFAAGGTYALSDGLQIVTVTLATTHELPIRYLA